MMINGNEDKKETYVNTSRNLTGKVFEQKKKVTDYFQLTQINDSLLQENVLLRKQLMQPIISMPIKDSTGTIIIKKDSVEKIFRYNYIAAKVIDNTFDQTNNYITINKGSKNNIHTGMAVLSNNGIAGKVVQTSANYAVVKSILSKRFAVSAKLKDGSIGKIIWDDFDTKYVTLDDISQSVKVMPGDSVFTSGFSSFPENILIGRLASVQGSESGTSFSFKVLLSTNFKKLHYVYAVDDVSGKEINALQDSAKAMDNIMDKTTKGNQ